MVLYLYNILYPKPTGVYLLLRLMSVDEAKELSQDCTKGTKWSLSTPVGKRHDGMYVCVPIPNTFFTVICTKRKKWPLPSSGYLSPEIVIMMII